MNDFARLSDLDLHYRIAEITSTLIENYAEYGLTQESVEALITLNEGFASDLGNAAAAANFAKASTAAKNASRQVVLDGIRQTTRTVYANPDVDDALLCKAGFSARPDLGRRTSPKEVTGLVAMAHAHGSVTLKWNRNGNSRSALFKVWAKGVTGPWVNVASTTKIKITLENFAPGVFKVFYVTATVNNQSSFASTYAAIYEAGSVPSNLPVAA